VALELELPSLKSIVIVKPSSLGDIVHTLPLLSLLKQHAPQARIFWVANSVWKPILDGHPLLEEVIEFPRQDFKGISGLGRFMKWSREQSVRQPDLVLDVQGLLRSGLICKALKGKRTIGYSDAREGAGCFHQESVDVTQKRSAHAVDRYLTFFQALGLPLPSPEDIDFPLPEGTVPEAASELPESGGFLVLHPFSRGVGKSLEPAQVEKLAADWSDLPVVLVGRGDVTGMKLGDNVVDILNRTTLAELIWVLRRANFVVSVDSGPMHLATAITHRVLSLHTWSDPAKVGPYRKDAWVWKAGEICQIRDYASPGLSEKRQEATFPDSALPQVSNFVHEQLASG